MIKVLRSSMTHWYPIHTLFKCPSPFPSDPSPLKIIHHQSYPHWPLKNSILTQWFPFPLRQYKECTSKDDKWLIPSFLSINLNFLIPWRYDYVTLTRRDWVTIIFLTPATVPTMATKMKLPQVSRLWLFSWISSIPFHLGIGRRWEGQENRF